MTPHAPPAVLVAAGVDPSGGAGLAADVRACESARALARTVPTSLTVQTSARVDRVAPVDPSLVADMTRAAVEDGVDASKVGLVTDPAVADALLDALPQGVPRVVDPVLVATSGDTLATSGMREAYLRLAHDATLVTPNAHEARALTGHAGAEDAAAALRKAGALNVLVTGGDESFGSVRLGRSERPRGTEEGARVTDVLVTERGDVHRFVGTRRDGRYHGTGCTLSALAAVHLAQGYALLDAVDAAIAETRERVASAFPRAGARVLPAGAVSLLPDTRRWNPDARERAAAVAHAWRGLVQALGREVVPEVGSNLSFLPADGDPDRAAALSARCVRSGTGITLAGPVEIGGFHHTARIAAAAHAQDPAVRAAMNLRHRPALVERALALGWRVGRFDRADEPPETESTMEWGTAHAWFEAGGRLDVVWDAGGPGKEPMIRVLGADPADVARKVHALVAPP